MTEPRKPAPRRPLALTLPRRSASAAWGALDSIRYQRDHTTSVRPGRTTTNVRAVVLTEQQTDALDVLCRALITALCATPIAAPTPKHGKR